MRRLSVLGLVISVGAWAGCSDSPPTMPPVFDAAAGAGGTSTGGAGGTGPGGGAGSSSRDAGADGPSAGGGSGASAGTGGSAVAGSGGSGVAGAGGSAVAGSGGGAGTGAGGMAGAGAGGMAGAGNAGGGGAAGGPEVLEPPAPLGLASLNSDFSTTSLSLLTTAGGLAHGDCVDSATGATGSSSKTISGDAVLPSQPQRGGDVVIVDRGNGALTFVDPTTCTIARQVALPGGAKTDPHDVVIVSDSKAYLTRYDQDLTASDPLLAGNDVAIIDPATGAPTGHIGLDAYASTVAGATILVRPDRVLIAEGKVVVSLDEIDAGFANYGEGKVVILDPATDTVTASVALTGLTDCEGLDYVASSRTLLVSCGGTYGAEDQPLQSGIAVVDLGVSPPALARSISAVAFDDRPVNFAWVLGLPNAVGSNRAFAGTYDPNGVTDDALFVFDFVVGSTAQFATSDPFTLGAAAGTPNLLFVPVASFSMPEIQLFDVTASPLQGTGFAPDPKNGLPPQEVAWY